MPLEMPVAVVVQRMIASDKARVMFTANPATHDTSCIVIEAARGLGEAVVQGQVTPDRYVVDKKTLVIRDMKVSTNGRVLSDVEVTWLATLALKVESHFGTPQDLEFAIDATGVYLTQTRPITTPQTKLPQAAPARSTDTPREVLVRGLGASPGVASEGALPYSKAGARAPEPLTVLLVEDHRVLRDELVSVLSAQPDIVVVGTAGDVESCVLAAVETNPLIILMEASLGGRSRGGRACVARVRNAAPNARVVVTDVPAVCEDVICFVEAGASGFIMKDATVDQLLATIRSVGMGDKVLPGELAATVFEHIARHVIDRPAPDAGSAVRLTSREREVVGLVAQGLSNKEIAGRMNLTTYTIKSHVHNVLEKLALHSRLELAAHAHESQRRSERA